jgi:hemoglobin/transferrin/lactoferrin receptor protein
MKDLFKLSVVAVLFLAIPFSFELLMAEEVEAPTPPLAESSVASEQSDPSSPPTVNAEDAEKVDSEVLENKDDKTLKKESSVVKLEPVVVTATRTEKAVFEVPYSVTVKNETEIRERQQARSLPDILKETPGVSVQKTGHGHGSPFIRGFTSFHNLLMIDGIRFNKPIFRYGPVQYWSSIDPLVVDRMEIVRGPGSALHGSDAVGGAVNVLTRGTDTWSENETKVGGGAYYRYGSAERSNAGRVEVKGSHKDKVGFLLGGSFKDHDDFVAGGGTGVVEYSGYQEYGVDAKVQYRPAEDHELTFLVQRWHQEEVPRTQTTVYAKPFQGSTVGNELRRDEDQDRLLSYVKYRGENLGPVVNDVEIAFSYQWTQEETFRTRANRRWDIQGWEVNTFGAQAQLGTATPIGRFTYGFDYTHDEVDSWRKDYNADGSLRAVRIQGTVGDDARYDLLGIYIQNEVPVFDERVTLTAGGRFTYAGVKAQRVENPDGGGEISMSKDWTNLIGSFRFIVRPDLDWGDHWRVFGGVSQAFRAPNLFDLSGMFAAAQVQTPTPDLSPENFLLFEIGTRARYEAVTFSTTWFHTILTDPIVMSPTGGFVDGIPEVQKQNTGRGVVRGIETAASWRFVDDFSLWGDLTWTEGNVDQFEGDIRRRKPMDWIVPAAANLGLRWEPQTHGNLRYWAEAYGTLASKADRLSLRDRGDLSRIPPGGTPGYGVCGVRGGIKLSKEKLAISAGVENIGNVEYRIHGSGQNEPGVNFKLSLDWRF